MLPNNCTKVITCEANNASSKKEAKKRTKLKDATIYRAQRPSIVPKEIFDLAKTPVTSSKPIY